MLRVSRVLVFGFGGLRRCALGFGFSVLFGVRCLSFDMAFEGACGRVLKYRVRFKYVFHLTDSMTLCSGVSGPAKLSPSHPEPYAQGFTILGLACTCVRELSGACPEGQNVPRFELTPPKT